jgi:hypothetical protein
MYLMKSNIITVLNFTFVMEEGGVRYFTFQFKMEFTEQVFNCTSHTKLWMHSGCNLPTMHYFRHLNVY